MKPSQNSDTETLSLAGEKPSFILTPNLLFLMDITVDRKITIDTIEEEKKKYEIKYTESVELYKNKLGEYAKYVERVCKTNPMDGLKNPPYPPTSNIERFEDSIDVLNAHVGATLIMTDDEYKELREGIRSLHKGNTTSINALSTLSY